MSNSPTLLGSSLPTTGRVATALFWNPTSLGRLMHRMRIHTRDDLAKVFGLPRTTVYNSFNADWSGQASVSLLAILASRLDVPLSRLVIEPRQLARDAAQQLANLG